LIEDLNFLDFVFVEFDFGFKMGIFFSELFHFLDDFLNFDSVLFGGNLIVDFFDLFLNVFDLFIDFFVRVFLILEFLFELELCVKEFLIELDA
jgi:hypothetical protein